MKKKMVLIISLIAILAVSACSAVGTSNGNATQTTTSGSDQLPTSIQTGCWYIQTDRQLYTDHSSTGKGIGHPVESIQRTSNQGHKGTTGGYRPVNPDQLIINNRSNYSNRHNESQHQGCDVIGAGIGSVRIHHL